MKETSVILMKDWKPLINALPESDRCYFFDLLLDYEYGVEQICERPMVFPVWSFVRSQLDKMKEKYENICEKNRNNGLKGGRPRKQYEPNETEKNRTVILGTEKTPNDNDNDNDNDKENDNKSLVDKKSTTKAKTDSAKYFVECRDLYFKFVKSRYNIEPIFTSKDGISLSKLLTLLEKRAIDKNPQVNYDLDFCLKTFAYVLNTAYQVEFIKNNFTIPILISQFNQILIQSTKNN